MKALSLRNCINDYFKLNRKKKNAIFCDPRNNNLIVFSPHDDCTVDSVCNSISDEAYYYLINELNFKNNIVVHWSQVSGTTSDYTIFYDMDIDKLGNKKYDEILKELNSIITNQNNCIGYKYCQVKNRNIEKITPEMMSNNIITYVFDYTDSEYLN